MKQLNIVLCLLFAGHATAQVAMMDLNDVPGDMPVCVTNWGPYVVANSVGLASHTNRTDNPHATTAAQIGALTAEADPIALAAIATNRVTRLSDDGGTELMDGAGNRYRIAYSGTWSVGGIPEYEAVGLTFPVNGYFRQFGDDTTLTIEAAATNIYEISFWDQYGQGAMYPVTWFGRWTNSAIAAASYDVTLHASVGVNPDMHFVFAGAAETQSVGTVALESSIAGIVYSNAVSQLVVWTNATGAATNIAWCEGGTWRTNALGGGSATLPAGVVTNGMAGPLTIGGVKLDTNKIEFTNDDGSTAVYQSGGALVIRSILGRRIYFFNGSGQITAAYDPLGLLLFGTRSILFGDDSQAGISYTGGNLEINPRRSGSGDVRVTAGNFGVDNTNTASVFVETGTPSWIVLTNVASACTLTNDNGRSARIYAAAGAEASTTGAVTFAALREAAPVYFTVQGFRELRFPDAYVVGGGAWQANRVNIFIVWRDGTNTFVSPMTTREAY